jgi:hypothetical protein
MPPSDEPMSSEIADVTVIEVCRELQNSQNTSPPKQTRIKSRLRRQARERRIARRRRQQISRERHARREVARNHAGRSSAASAPPA